MSPPAARVFLGFSALVWLPYGLFCFFRPESLAEIAGVAASSATGTIELRAMYGGLQCAIGLLALAALLRDSLVPTALLALACLCAGLGLARLGASALSVELSTYTAFALAFEVPSASLAIWLYRRSAAAAAS